MVSGEGADYGRAARRGVAYTGVAQAARLVIGFASGIVLARLLTPEDFGLVAMLSPAVAFVGLIQDMGLGQATIQRERITKREVDTLFWVTCALSIVLAAVLALAGPALAGFFREPQVAPLAIAFAGLVVIWSLSTQPVALLSREMRFKELAVIDVAAAALGLLVGAAVAYVFRTYWALLAGMLASALVSVVGTWAVLRFRPGRPSFGAGIGEILGFGGSVSGFNVLNFFARNADAVLIARAWGAFELGLYERAYKLLLLPLQQVTNPLGRVMIPFLSRHQSDPLGYRAGYRDAVTLLMILTQPGILVAIVFAPDVFRVLLGERWVAAAPIFAWLGIAGLHQVMTSTLGWLFISQGRGRDYLLLGAVGATITVTAFVIGLPYGAVGVAMAYAISDVALKMPLAWYLATRRGPISLQDLVTLALPHLVGLVVAVVVLLGTERLVDDSGFAALAGMTVSSYCIYLTVLLAFPEKRHLLVKHADRVVGALREIVARRAPSAEKEET